MEKVWEILLKAHPEELAPLANLQWEVYGTKLDFLTSKQQPVNIQASYPSLDQIDKTMREKPRQLRGVGW